MADEIQVLPQRELPVTHKAEHEPYEYWKREVIPRAGFPQCIVSVYELPPGKANYPYHYHMANTEVFYILSGMGILTTPNGERPVNAGDFIVCPPGERGAHKITNASMEEPLRYSDFDTASLPDVPHYPDSGKTGVAVRGYPYTFFEDKDEVEYYRGE